jgi:TATA-box binding protein (TBP) (component of TFIID and TFIIIB)
MGNDSFIKARKDIRKYARLIAKMNYNVSLKSIKLVTQSAVATLSGKLNLFDAYKVLKGHFEPEVFHALMLKQEGMHFTCFPSGKIVITGVKVLKKTTSLLWDLELFT